MVEKDTISVRDGEITKDFNTMSVVKIQLPGASYSVHIANGLLDRAGHMCSPKRPSTRALVITNDRVGPLYAKQLNASLSAAGYRVAEYQLPDGELHKNIESVQQLYDACLSAGLDRSSVIFSLGGGVVGDLAGFVAGTFMRGLSVVHLPTSLLAMVDASVGGKTGYDLAQGKNLVGMFKQPSMVLIDPLVLKTLAKREFACGMAEVIKHGIIGAPELFESLEAGQLTEWPSLIEQAVSLKAGIVEQDETETGVRAHLNLGHTFGHAVETLSGYGVVKHGEAVAIGMVMAARTSASFNLCSNDDIERIVKLLAYFDLPVIPPDFSVTEYLSVMQRDKKVKDGVVRVVLNHGIGTAELHQVKDLDKVLGELLT